LSGTLRSICGEIVLAKPLPNEEDLYQRIHDEGIAVSIAVWDLMYDKLGDAISAINLLVSFYIEKNEAIPLTDAQRILEQTRLIRDGIQRIFHLKDGPLQDSRWPLVPENEREIHPLIRDFLTHYVGNDTHMINLCVSFYLDPLDPQPIPVEDAKKILAQTLSMRVFLDRLRRATLRESPD